jgi:flagellar biosynthesis chaperone FliJ
LTQAAQQSIDTLQRIIDEKNDQLKRKDQIVDSLKRELIKSKE